MLATSSLGCGGDDESGNKPGVEGQWRSSQPTVDKFNAMSIEDGGMGSATVYIFQVVANVASALEFRFDVVWTEESSIDIELTCQSSPFMSGCIPEDDATMSCSLSGANNEALTCQAGEGQWKDYDFNWKRVES